MAKKYIYMTPSRLLNELGDFLNTNKDIEVAAHLGISGSMLSKIRSGDNALTCNMVLRIYDVTGWSIERIRELAGYDGKQS